MNARTRIKLDGPWKFWTDPGSSLSPASLALEQNMEIMVPAPWQSQSPELRHYSGAAWYRRTVEIPASWTDGGCVILGIEASDYCTEAWFNDVKIGEHEGGYLPFEFDVTNAVRPGQNTITIRVDDPPGSFAEVPHGKQSWYGPLSGIWQSVWLECRSPLHIRSLSIFPDLEAKCVQAHVRLSGLPHGPGQVKARLIAPGGETAAVTQAPVPFRGSQVNLAMSLGEVSAWSPDQPYLYRFEVELNNEQGPIDRASKHFGFRAITSRDGRLFLNGEPLYLRGALDQDYYLDTICTPPDEQFLEDQIIKAKQLGLNCLRCHIKVADPRYYDAADRLGMLIWAELPNWSVLTEDSGERGRETLKGILDRDGHHPSIITWTIINEDWGTDLVNEPSHRSWLKGMYRWLKALDPTRLVVDNSACEPNYHLQTDVEDYHFYRAIPDHRREWDQFVNAFASRADWTFCPNGEAVRTRKEPLVVSEFGNWGLPDIDLLKDEQGNDPWWFDTGAEWGEGVVLPQSVRARFRALGLEKVFGSWRDFIEATQWQQYLAMKYEIESMRKRPEICGYVITELTDVHWECNGLLDMRRNPKVFHEVFRTINADTVLIPEWDRVVYWEAEEARIGLTISHGAGEPLEGAEIRWKLESGAQGRLSAPRQHAGEVQQVGAAVFQIPRLAAPSVLRLAIELVSSNGEPLANNHLDLSVHPRQFSLAGVNSPRIYSSKIKLASRLEALGYELTRDLSQAELVVTDRVDSGILAFLQDGGRALVLADRIGAEDQVLPGVRLAARKGAPWCGDWVSSFSWVARQGAFARLPGGPLIDLSFDCLIPDYVLTGFRDWEFPALVKAGMVIGWVHRPAALIGERGYGKGRAVINTFRLDDADLGQDPTATALMHALIEHAARL